MTNENLEYIKQTLPFWDKLNANQQELIIQNTAEMNYQKGQNVHCADKECVGVLLVKSGELRAYILSEEGKEVTLYRLLKGDVCMLSASCIFQNITFDVHIDAEKTSEVLAVNAKVFERLNSENIYAENFSLKATVDKFSSVMKAMEQILFMSFDKRLATFLINESKRTGADNLTITHEQIARHLGSAREVVSRMIKQFENEGIVELCRGTVKIKDRDRLNLIAE